MRAPLLFALIGALLWFISGFYQGTLRHSADPELVLGITEAVKALGLFALITGGVALARLSADPSRRDGIR